MDPQLLRRGGQRRERKTANVETVCECVRDGPGSSGCRIFLVLWTFSSPKRRSRHSSIPQSRYGANLDADILTLDPRNIFEEMQRKLRLNIHPQTSVWINIQTFVAF